MPNPTYDLVTIGGGIAASPLARAMAERGYRVLVLEREKEFKDRIRGEALLPWGCAEAQKLGVLELLREKCGHEQPWFDVYLGPHQLMHRDLLSTTPQRAPILSFYHPRMQEVLITAAGKAGAEILRGATVTEIRPGSPAVVSYQLDGKTHEIQARLVVAADGRVSPARAWGGFTVEHDPSRQFMAGTLLENSAMPQDINYVMTNPAGYNSTAMFPQGGGRVRAYFAYPVTAGFRLQGAEAFPQFVREGVAAGMPAAYFDGATCAGPLASFEIADTWVPHPYKNGVALVGDAAAASDPAWGNGMSMCLRDGRMLRDRLLAKDDWDAAAHEYAADHDHAYDVIHSVTTWMTQVFAQSGPEADARRAKALPLIAADPTRVPDHGISGPDLPFDREATRARFFGEA